MNIKDQMIKISETSGFEIGDNFQNICDLKEKMGLIKECPYQIERKELFCICKECAFDIINNGECKYRCFKKRN